MVELMSRCIAFAEGVVTMLCPAFLALALRKDKLRLDDPKVSLILAAVTLIAGVSPLLACLISKSFPGACERWARVTRRMAAPLSCIFLIVLAFVMSTSARTNTADIWAEFAISILFGSLVMIRTLVAWWFPSEEEKVLIDSEKLPVASSEEIKLSIASEEEEKVRTASEEEKLCGKIDKSHEFLSGITGIVFLWLEGMAGLVYAYKGLESGLRGPMLSGLIFCGIGVALMSVHMIPILENKNMALVVHITDGLVVVGTGIILMTITTKFTGNKGWLFLLPPVFVFISPVREWLWYLGTPAQGNDFARQTPAQGEECKAAPLGLTKLMFTGFLGVSVMRATGSDLPVLLTDLFIIAAAAAIASGILWRLLTHLETWNKTAANAAPFCTHLCVVVAAILLAVMACRDRQDVIIQCPPGSQN